MNYTTHQFPPPANIDDCWLELVADTELLELAFQWCCKAREHFPPSADIWIVRERWHKIKPELTRKLLDGSYRFAPMVRYRTNDEDRSRAVWDALDAIVVKAISMVLTIKLQSDISSDPDKRLLELLMLTISRSELLNGNLVEINQGIALGSPLSPFLAAIYLQRLDAYARFHRLSYARFMDDFIFLCNSKTALKKIIAVTTLMVSGLKLLLHETKTGFGLIRNGFTLLGFSWNLFRVIPQFCRLVMVYCRLCLLPPHLAINYFIHYRAYVRGCGLSF